MLSSTINSTCLLIVSRRSEWSEILVALELSTVQTIPAHAAAISSHATVTVLRLACRRARTSFFDLESKPSEISCAAAATLYKNDLVCGRIAETHYPYVQGGRTDLGEGTIDIDERGNSNPLRNTLQLDAQRIELLLSNYAQRRVGYGSRSPFGPALRTPLVVFPPILPALARLTNFLTLINCC